MFIIFILSLFTVSCGSFNQARVPAVITVEGGESIKTETDIRIDVMEGIRSYCHTLASSGQEIGKSYHEENYNCLQSFAQIDVMSAILPVLNPELKFPVPPSE